MPIPCSDEDFTAAVASNYSIAGVIRQLGRSKVGTNYDLIKREVVRLGLSTAHWTGQRHGTSKQLSKVPTAEILVAGRPAHGHLKERILRENLIPEVCAICGVWEWLGSALVLHLDHVSGDGCDNRLENLRLLCPNCHSQTPTYCGRNKRIQRDVPTCRDCGVGVSSAGRRCLKCAAQGRPTKVVWPSIEVLQQMVDRSSVLAVSRNLGVSDAAVSKRLKRVA